MDAPFVFFSSSVDFSGVLLASILFKELEKLKLSSKDLGDYISAKEGDELQSLIQMSNFKIRFLPIINDDGILVDYFRYEHRTKMMLIHTKNLALGSSETIMIVGTPTKETSSMQAMALPMLSLSASSVVIDLAR